MEQYAMLRGKTDALMSQYGNLLSDLVAAPAEQGPASPGQHLIDTSLNRFLDSYYHIKGRHESHALSVGLLALTKSGKSTFLNVLLGDECMPSGTVPETARICRIVHDPNLTEPIMLDDGDILQGSPAVRQRLRDLNSAIRQRGRRVAEEEILSISAPLASLTKLPAMPTKLHLLDTPGPNEAGEEGLKHQVERLLDGIGVLVYLLDCSKLKTQEEKQMFQRLKEINPQLLKRLSNRLFFLVNKKDVLHDMEDEEVCEYVAELVTEQMGDQEFQLDPQQVMLISAKTALYSRLVMTGKASPEQRVVFAKMAFGNYGYKQATEQKMLDAAHAMFEGSGIPTVEERLLQFLYGHAGRIQLMGTMDDMARNLTQVMNTFSACEAVLQRGVEEVSVKLSEMGAQVEHATRRFEDVHQCTERVEQEVTDEIRARLSMLKERLFLQVEAVLSESSCSEKLPAPWARVWSNVQKALHVARTTPEHAPRAEAEMQNRLADMYLSISDQVGEEVRCFWHELESVTNQRQQQLFGILNSKIQDLSGEFESVVMERLDIRLEAADLRISPPSSEEYHHDLGKLFADGITREEVSRRVEHVVEETVIERGYTVPMCKLGEYYYTRPVTRTETSEIKETKVTLSPDKVKEFFMEHVDSMVTASVRAVRLYVREYLSKQVSTARSALGAYCASYQAVMAAALAEGSRSEEDRVAALARARQRLQEITELKAAMEVLAVDIEGARPEEVEEAEGVLVGEVEGVLVGEGEAEGVLVGDKEVVAEGVLVGEVAGAAGSVVVAASDEAVVGVVEGGEGVGEAAVVVGEEAEAEGGSDVSATEEENVQAALPPCQSAADGDAAVEAGLPPVTEPNTVSTLPNEAGGDDDLAPEVDTPAAAALVATRLIDTLDIDNSNDEMAVREVVDAADEEKDAGDGLDALLAELESDSGSLVMGGSGSGSSGGDALLHSGASSGSAADDAGVPPVGKSTVDAGAQLLAEMGAALEAATASDDAVPSPAAIVRAEVDAAEALPPSSLPPADNGSGSTYDYGAAFMSAMSMPAGGNEEGDMESVGSEDDFVLVKS